MALALLASQTMALPALAFSSCQASPVPVIQGQAETGKSRAVCMETTRTRLQDTVHKPHTAAPSVRALAKPTSLTDSYPERRTILQRELASAQAALSTLGGSAVAGGGANAAQAHRVQQDIESLRREIARLR